MTFSKEEIQVITKLVSDKNKSLDKELALMSESSEHFFVNEGLLNEVRHETEKMKRLKEVLEVLNDKLQNCQ